MEKRTVKEKKGRKQERNTSLNRLDQSSGLLPMQDLSLVPRRDNCVLHWEPLSERLTGIIAFLGCRERGSTLNYPSPPNYSFTPLLPFLSKRGLSLPRGQARPFFSGSIKLCGVLGWSLISPGLCPPAELLASTHGEGNFLLSRIGTEMHRNARSMRNFFGASFATFPTCIQFAYVSISLESLNIILPTNWVLFVEASIYFLVFKCICLAIGAADALWDRTGENRKAGGPSSTAGPVPSSHPSPGE